VACVSPPGPSQTQPLAHSLPDAARQLGGVSVSFLRLEIARGNLRAVHCGRRVLILHEELLRYLAAGTESTTR
jgi:excisionase family DNA binding protein